VVSPVEENQKVYSWSKPKKDRTPRQTSHEESSSEMETSENDYLILPTQRSDKEGARSKIYDM